MTKQLEVDGVDGLLKALDGFYRKLESRIQKDALAGMKGVVQWVRQYPPETEANRPRYGAYGSFYRRGVGAAYSRKSGGTTQYHGSEQLGSRWTVQTSYGPYTSRATNTASYADVVHGRATQAAFHKRRGWRTVEDAIARELRRITTALQRTVKGAIDSV